MPENGDRDGSIRQLEAYLDDHPDSERFAELAEHLVEEGRFEEAVKTCERGIGFHPELAAGHVVYGKALVGMEMLDEGIQAFERACTLRSNDVGLLAEVGKFLVDSGQREAAFPYLEKGKEIDAEDPRIMHLETELGGAVPADHERIETARLDGDGAEPQAGDEPGEPSDPPPEDDQDDDSLRVPTDKISWPAWESQPPPAKDAFASDDDDDDIEQDFEPPTVYSQNPLAAQQGAGDADEKHPPLSEEFEAASTVEVADSEELAKAIERQQQETMTDEQAGLTAEVSEAVNQAAAPPGEPPTMFDPQEPAGASPWAAEDASSPSPPAEPPTMFEGAQAEAADAEPPPTQFTGSPSGAVVSYQHAVDAPAEHFSYLKVFLVLVPFLVVGLALGGWVAYRHIRSEKINSLLDQVLTSISQDTFLGYSDAQSTVTELLELDDENPRGNALAALVATRLHDEYGPNLTLKEEGQRILEQEKTTPQNAVDLLWTRYHLGADEHLESAVKVVQEQLPSDPRLLGLAGEMAAKRGKAKEAAALLERSLNEQPSSVRTLYALAGLELKQGKTKKATEHLERALAINGIHVRSLLALSGLRLKQKKQLARAKTDLEKILELPQVTSKRRAEAHLLLARLFFERFERSRGLAEVKAASELLPDYTKFQIRLARLCREYFELEETATRAGKVLEANPDEIETRLLLIGSDLPRGRIEKVKRALSKLIGKKVPASPFLVLRGEALVLSGRYAKALSDLSSVKPGTPEKPRARAMAVLARLGLGDTDGAYRAAKSLLADHRGYALAHFSMGQVRLSKRMNSSATTSFKMAAELDPRCYQALTLLAHLANDRRRYEEAEGYAILALRANPHAQGARKLLGRLKLRKGDAEGALKDFARAVSELETSREGFVGMAESLLVLNQVDKALKAIEKAREVGASDAHAFWVEGRIHLARGKFFPAVRALKKAKREDEKNPEILADLGLAQLGSRSLTRAEKTLKESLKRRRLLRAQEGLAKVYRERRKYKDAAKAFSSAAYLAGRKGRSAEEVAELYVQGGKAWLNDRRTKNRYVRARHLFRKAAKLMPDDVPTLYLIAESYDREEKLSPARRAYLDVLKKDANHAQALYRLGLIEYDEGSDKKAKEYLERYLKTGAKGRDANRARKLLSKIK
jgi:Flp pilus assembly protein TadD